MSKRKYGSVIFIIYYLLFLFLLFLFSFLFLFLFLFLILILFLFLHIFYFYFFNYFNFFLNIIIYFIFFFCHLPGMQHLEMMISHLIVGHYLAFQGNGYIQPKPIIVTTLYDKEKKCCII